MPRKIGLQKEILTDIETIKKDKKLHQELNFSLRSQAIDDLEFHIIDRIDALLESTVASDSMHTLKQYAKDVELDLKTINTNMFRKLRNKIAQEGNREKLLKHLIDEYLDRELNTFLKPDEIGYDDLDLFFNELLTEQDLPEETLDREPEMIFYQKTPARIILELINKANFKPHDVFFDLGSGLGQVSILVNLLTSVLSMGVEFEPSFCKYAMACATELNLTSVKFINIDARHADYGAGTVFFLYTPFEGKMLQDVLQKLNSEAKKRKIRVFTYGPCTPHVAKKAWLINQGSCSGLGEFVSF